MDKIDKKKVAIYERRYIIQPSLGMDRLESTVKFFY